MISSRGWMLTTTRPIGMSNFVRIGSHQRSRCCLCHEAGVPGSCGHQLGEIGCQEQNPAFPAPCPQFPLPTPDPLMAKRPSLPALPPPPTSYSWLSPGPHLSYSCRSLQSTRCREGPWGSWLAGRGLGRERGGSIGAGGVNAWDARSGSFASSIYWGEHTQHEKGPRGHMPSPQSPVEELSWVLGCCYRVPEVRGHEPR